MKMMIISLLVYCSSALASEALTTKSFTEVFEKIEEKTKLYGRDKVLVVLDIDNTLLTAKNDLGSDHWFSWQEQLLKDPNCAPACVSNEFSKIIEIQELLLTMNQMRPTEAELPLMIKKLQKKKQPIILLTSRAPDWRHLTEKSLRLNSMDFTATAIPGGNESSYLPYVLADYQRYSLTAEDLRDANLKEARPVSYKNGIYMTEGQNKGIMLKVFLNKFRTSFQSVVFVDDHQKHVDRMHSILGNKLDLVTFRYAGVDELVEKFKANTSAAVLKWINLRKALHEAGFSL